jgi:hypothetical protein
VTRIEPDEALANAGKYLRRRGMAPGRASTLRKAMRAQRINLGERPLRITSTDELVTARFVFEGRIYERVAIRKLKPTRGWKVVDRSVREA